MGTSCSSSKPSTSIELSSMVFLVIPILLQVEEEEEEEEEEGPGNEEGLTAETVVLLFPVSSIPVSFKSCWRNVWALSLSISTQRFVALEIIPASLRGCISVYSVW